jgi:hypothetical protein
MMHAVRYDFAAAVSHFSRSVKSLRVFRVQGGDSCQMHNL